MVERTLSGWGSPQILPSPVNSSYNDMSYNQTSDGIGYFDSDRPGGAAGSWNIWRTLPQQPGQPLHVEILGNPLNSTGVCEKPNISPDGSFLIYESIGANDKGVEDLYVSFAKGNGNWTAPVNCGNINSGDIDGSPRISPDGRYLFFSRLNVNAGICDIYWVSTNFIAKLRYSNFPPYLKTQVPDQKDTVGHPFNYQIPDTTFVDDNGNNTLSYSAKQSNGLALPSWLAFDTTTRMFSGTPATTGVITIKVTATDTANTSTLCTFKMRVYPGTTAVEEDKNQLPKKSQLLQNYPNPFNPSTVISYQLAVTSNVSLKVFDLSGREVANLINEQKPAGSYSEQWNASNLPSGIYFYRLQAGLYSETRKLVLLK